MLPAALALVGSRAGVTTAPPNGVVYKHLTYMEEAGDLLGMVLRIRRGKHPTVTVTTCEGECYGGKVWPLRLGPHSIAFTVCDDVEGQHGRPAPCEAISYVGRFRADGALVIVVRGQPESRLVLERVRHPKSREVEELAGLTGWGRPPQR